MNKRDVEMVAKLREKVSDLITPDFTDFDFLRWLKEYHYDLDLIVPNLRYHFRFIRCYDFSLSVQPTDPYFAIMNKYWSYGLIDKAGKDNNFVFIENLGTMDGEGFRKTVPKASIYFERFYKSEQLMTVFRKQEKESGRQSKMVVIVDFRGSRVSLQNVSLMKNGYNCVISNQMKHYKDMVEKCIVVNTPSLMNVIYKILRPVLPQRIKDAIIFLGPNWKTDILQHVDANVLPAYLGGNYVDENNDPMCRSKICFPSTIPKELYWKPSAEEANLEEFNILTISPGSHKFISVEVKEFGKRLRWMYYTDKEWGIGVFYTDTKDETDPDVMDMVFPQLHYIAGNACLAEHNSIECKRLGFYKIWFNNSFSYFRKLIVHYKVFLENVS